MRKTWIILAVLLLCTIIGTVSAIPITFNQNCDVTIKYLGGSAGFNNDYGWVSGGTPPAGTLNKLGVGNINPNPSLHPIGLIPANNNIYLYIQTNEQSPLVYYSDPASANPDSIEHVTVTPIDPTAVIVNIGFEDLLNGGDKDFNDVYLQVNCDPVITPPPVPEFPTMALPLALIIGMLGAVLFIRKSKEQ